MPPKAIPGPIVAPRRRIASDFSKAVIGLPKTDDLEFFGCRRSREALAVAVRHIRELGAKIVPVDYAPFAEVAQMIYRGPWMAERYATHRTFFESHPAEIHPITYGASAGSTRFSAADAFEAEHRLKDLQRAMEPIWDRIDAIVTPTVPRAYPIDKVLADPVQLNNNLGF
jgi:allophanate hydrolase